MIFLSPLWLALSAAALIPLLLHLRRRPQGRIVEFPAVRYLARATHDHERSLRARNSLLALLRMLLVLLLALAAARPLARIGTGHGRAAVALLLDNSLSTSAVSGGRRVLDDEKAAARALVAGSSPGDRVWLVTADGRVTGGDGATLRAAIDTITVLPGAGNLGDALRAAIARTRGVSPATPVVVVFTDAQSTTWRTVAGLAAEVVFIPSGSPPPNRSITSAEPRPARWTGSGAVHVALGGAAPGDTVPLRIEIAGRTLGRGVVAPDAVGVGETDVTVADAPEGWSAARAVLAPDELAADDERWFASWNAPPPRVSSRAGAFADRAIDALISAGIVAAGREVTVASADEVVGRPALAVAPLDPSRIGAANRALDRAGIPWRLGAERRESSRAHGAGLANVDVRRRYALTATAAAPAETLATVAGEPWIVAGDGYVLVASAFDTAATTLPATAEFVPWLASTLSERLAGSGRPATRLAPGSMVAVPAGIDGVETPEGEKLPVADSLRPSRAGVYFWTRGGARVGAVTVNGEVEESVLQRMGDDEMRHRLPGATVTHDAAAAAAAAWGRASRRPLGTVLLAAVLAVLLVETLVAAVPARGRVAPHRAAEVR